MKTYDYGFSFTAWLGAVFLVSSMVLLSACGAGSSDGDKTDADVSTNKQPSTFKLTAKIGHQQASLSWQTGIGTQHYVIYQNDTSIHTTVSTQHTVKNLINGTTYTFKIQAINSTGRDAFSKPLSVIPMSTPDIKIKLGDGRVNLRWQKVAGADAYVIYQNYHTSVHTTVSTQHTITGLINGDDYLFTVKAINSLSESLSTPKHIIPMSTLSSLNVSMHDKKIILNWQTVIGAQSYAIYQNETLIHTTVSAQHTVKNLIYGTIYAFKIQAINGTGRGAFSRTLSVMPQATIVVVAKASNRQVILSWNFVPEANYYVIHQSQESFADIKPQNYASLVKGGKYRSYTRQATRNSFTVPKLIAGVSYYFVVTAFKGSRQIAISQQVVVKPIFTEGLLLEHSAEVRSAAFSPDSQRIVSGSLDRTIRVWSSTTGRQILVLNGHTEGVNSVDFSPDGQRIVSGSLDRTIRVWNSTTGRQILVLRGHTEGVNSVDFSPDGQRIVSSGAESGIFIWNAHSGKKLKVFGVTTTSNVVYSSVAFHPTDNERIVGGGNDKGFKISTSPTVYVWNIGNPKKAKQLLTLRGHKTSINSVTFSRPKGYHIASADQSSIYIWASVQGLKLHELPKSKVTSLNFNPDGYLLVSGTADGKMNIWQTYSGKELWNFKANARAVKAHQRRIASVSFSPDGKHIVSSSGFAVRVWRVPNLQYK